MMIKKSIVTGTLGLFAIMLSANRCNDEPMVESGQNESTEYNSNLDDADADATLGSGSSADGYVTKESEDDSDKKERISESRHGYENFGSGEEAKTD